MTGFITVSIKDNYSLLSPKLRRKETSGDEHQEDTLGPGDHAAEGLPCGGDLPASGGGKKPLAQGNGCLETNREWTGILPGHGREKPSASHGFAVGSSAEEVQTLFTSAWELLH